MYRLSIELRNHTLIVLTLLSEGEIKTVTERFRDSLTAKRKSRGLAPELDIADVVLSF